MFFVCFATVDHPMLIPGPGAALVSLPPPMVCVQGLTAPHPLHVPSTPLMSKNPLIKQSTMHICGLYRVCLFFLKKSGRSLNSFDMESEW